MHWFQGLNARFGWDPTRTSHQAKLRHASELCVFRSRWKLCSRGGSLVPWLDGRHRQAAHRVKTQAKGSYGYGRDWYRATQEGPLCRIQGRLQQLDLAVVSKGGTWQDFWLAQKTCSGTTAGRNDQVRTSLTRSRPVIGQARRIMLHCITGRSNS